jgi:Cu2+-exporting ATPase
MTKIKQNLGWAFAYNLVGIPLAAGALLPGAGVALTPSVAGALMGLSSLAVMGNSLTLQWDAGARHAPVAAAAAGPGSGAL